MSQDRKFDVAIRDDSDDVVSILSVTTDERQELQVQLPIGWTVEVISDGIVLPPGRRFELEEE